jgi:hypothetical protein
MRRAGRHESLDRAGTVVGCVSPNHLQANGNFLACGLPAKWPIEFISGFEDYQAWHQFSADGTLDIERRQP